MKLSCITYFSRRLHNFGFSTSCIHTNENMKTDSTMNGLWPHPLLLTTMLLLGACGYNSATAAQAGAPTPLKSGYTIGERLPVKPPATAPDRPAQPVSFRETTWNELIPKDWDPNASFKNLNLGTLKDSDPRAMEALATLRAVWDNAPTATEMNGAAIRIAGFIVPLERDGDAVRELLLVPYFGACVHVPPPPANQIIHVIVDPALKSARTMEAMWISGTLETVRSPTSLGTSGYRMKASKIVPYTRPAR